MEAIGAVDECNAAIGSALAIGLPETLSSILRTVQGRLFIVGSELMAPDHTGGGSSLPRLVDQDVTELEDAIDSLESTLPELRNFIVPGRPEEARAIGWEQDVDLDGDPPSVAVLRADRAGGDTKTPRSRRVLQLAQMPVGALREWQVDQAAEREAAGSHWQDTGRVFTTATGTPLGARHIRKMFQDVCERAGLGRDWAPRDLRHTFVSLLSDDGMAIEKIARLVGHASSHVTETVYRNRGHRAAGRRRMAVLHRGMAGDRCLAGALRHSGPDAAAPSPAALLAVLRPASRWRRWISPPSRSPGSPTPARLDPASALATNVHRLG